MKPNAVPRRGRHPLHAATVHFPMALLMISTLWDILGLWRGDEQWWRFAFWSISVGLIFAIAALFTGIMDYIKIPQGGPAERAAIRHMMFMVAAIALYAGSFMVRYREPVMTGGLLIIAVALSAAGLILLLIGGWHGGELVFRHGAGSIGSGNQEIQIQEERH